MSVSQSRDLQDQKALVTGATSRIGRAIALQLARDGAQVIVHGRDASSPSSRWHARAVSAVRALAVPLDHDLEVLAGQDHRPVARTIAALDQVEQIAPEGRLLDPSHLAR